MNKHYPKVYILILNYNGWKDTIECLESVFRNSYPNYQVVVIDNGSPNGSMEKIKGWANGEQEVLCPDSSHPLYHLSHPFIKKPIPYVYYTREEAENGGNPELEKDLLGDLEDKRPNIHSLPRPQIGTSTYYPLTFIQTGDNLGFAGGNNVGIRYALAKGDCDYVLLLNNDTVADNDFLEPMIRFATDDTECGIAGPTVLYYDMAHIINCAGGKINFWKGSSPHFRVGEVYDEECSYEKKVNFKEGSCLLIKKEVLETIGLFDESYFLYYEDADFCVRAAADYGIVYVSRSKIWHKVSATSDALDSTIKIYFGLRNKIYFMRKHARFYHWIVFLPFLTYMILRMVVKFVVKERLGFARKIRCVVRAVKDGSLLPL